MKDYFCWKKSLEGMINVLQISGFFNDKKEEQERKIGCLFFFLLLYAWLLYFFCTFKQPRAAPIGVVVLGKQTGRTRLSCVETVDHVMRNGIEWIRWRIWAGQYSGSNKMQLNCIFGFVGNDFILMMMINKGTKASNSSDHDIAMIDYTEYFPGCWYCL